MEPLDETATAYHEAGHAVMAMALGRPIQRVSIKANHLRLGHCTIKKGSFKTSSDLLETEVLILLAGLAAEARQTGTYNLEAAAQDLRDVRWMTRLRAGSDRQIERLERRLLDKAEHILNRPGMWVAVEWIAAELLKTTTISGRAARHFFERATEAARQGS